MSKRASIFQRVAGNNSSGDAATQPAEGLPAYTAETPATDQQQDQQPTSNGEDTDEINLAAAFEKLKLTNLPSDPNVESCLAHLKLLFAIQSMKEDVGFKDGFLGLWDARAGPITRPPEKKDEEQAEQSAEDKMRDQTLAALSQVREKRWALFVAQAADRYEIWWKSLARELPVRPLCERDMVTAGSNAYETFPTDLDSLLDWTEDMLPPLDVLMVWHTHMLNPRAYLEDAMLAGLRHLWATGLPWHLIDKAIDNNTFKYNVSLTCKTRWFQQTRLHWEDPGALHKTISCPRCDTLVKMPWTTADYPENVRQKELNLTGRGYGDNEPSGWCSSCTTEISRELLSAAKFVEDTKALLGSWNRPMPGTVLDPTTGMPSRSREHTFPNRVLKSGHNSIRSKITGLITSRTIYKPTMKDVRMVIETVLSSRTSVRAIERVPGTRRFTLPKTSRIAVRKMMSRYWENSSAFALDLRGAVMRQGIFVEKMCQLDWLHSPSARETMARLLVKYGRFFEILKASPGQMAVPTLDIDLAWHTHQLSPSRYYAYTCSTAGRFTDHDDKVDESRLSTQFEWTSKEYQERYGEVYSECTCWYCEAIRTTHISTVGKVLGISKQEKVAETFHTSGAASLHPPSTSAHISAHPSVQTTLDPALTKRPITNNPAMKSMHIHARLTAIHNQRLATAHAKACARAKRKGREPPRREDIYYDHWGYPYAYSAPYVYAMWWTPGLYAGYYPGGVAGCGTGSWGACVSGTCGGGWVAGGGSGGGGGGSGDSTGGGGIAGCGGGCGGGSGGSGGGGCGGGGGGGCGGGGGGGCGGGS